MSAGWAKRRDIDPLADGQARFEFAIPLTEFVRLQPQLAAGQDQTASGHVQFSRDQGFAVADLEVHATVPLVCQRCLAPVLSAVNERSRVVLVGTEAEADSVPPGIETVLASDRRISLRDLVEEELLLAVPAVPLHEGPGDCAARPQREDTAAEPTNVHRPFERLGELLKRDR